MLPAARLPDDTSFPVLLPGLAQLLKRLPERGG